MLYIPWMVILRDHHPSFVTHVLGRIYVFFTLFGYWERGGGGQMGLVHNLLMQFFILYSSEIELLETYFFDTVLT